MADARPPARTGVLLNAQAGRARRDPQLVERLRALLPPGRVQATADASAIDPALDALRAAGIDTLVLVGGDGTVGGTLTRLLARWPAAELPALLIAAGGTVNTIARSLGARGAPDLLLRELLQGARTPRESLRPLLRVRVDGEPPRCGMIFANGVAVRWLRTYYEDSPRGVRGALSVVGRTAISACVGGEFARRLFAPFSARVDLDGERLAQERFTVMAAASVSQIGLGFPLFHLAGRDPERFHFATTDSGAARVALALPALRLGSGYGLARVRHFPVRRVELRFGEPQLWSLDADVFPAVGELRLEATRPLRFLLP